jgi:FkbM family methyltransferase
MYKSLKNLYSSPYNKTHKWFALKRFIHWKLIRGFKSKNVKFKLWEDRYLLLNHDSFQSMWVMYNYIVDWEEFNLIKHVLRPRDTVLDVGANMGFYTIWMSKFIHEGHIHSFEPDDENFKRLNGNIELNALSKVAKINKVAVGDYDGEVTFTKGLDGENHISLKSEPEVVAIPITQLDSYAAENDLENIRYCKIDVEGFELAVLRGASRLLSSKRIDVLQLEINNTLSNSNVSVEDLLQYLDHMGYSLCSFEVSHSTLNPINYSKERENYFAVSDIDALNNELKKNR